MLTAAIRDEAMAGDLVALEMLGDPFTGLLCDSSYRSALNIVLRNMRPQIMPKIPFDATKELHCH